MGVKDDIEAYDSPRSIRCWHKEQAFKASLWEDVLEKYPDIEAMRAFLGKWQGFMRDWISRPEGPEQLAMSKDGLDDVFDKLHMLVAELEMELLHRVEEQRK